MRRELELRTLLARYTGLNLDRVPVDTDLLEHYGLDSLSGLRLLAAVEKHFGVRFPDERLNEFRTLRQILSVIPTSSEEDGP